MKTRRTLWSIVIVVTCSIGLAKAQAPVGTAFTYQGQLKQGGLPVMATADFQFTLWDAATTPPGVQIGTMLLIDGKNVVNGLFTVDLDFGAGAFPAETRWLEVAVRSPTGTGNFQTLSPRQELTPVPFALNAAGPWITSPSGLYYTQNNVGIGTTAPSCPLHVAGTNATTLSAENTNAEGVAVSGRATSVSGANCGVYGETKSAQGSGVYGVVTRLTGNNAGVRGEHAMYDGYGIGVDGLGGYIGVHGWTESEGDQFYSGVYGESYGHGTGTNCGVTAYATGSGANYGIQAVADGPGPNYSVYGWADSRPNNWAGYFDGPGYFAGPVGIGTTSASCPLHVEGSHAAGTNAGLLTAVNTATVDETPAVFGKHSATTDHGIGVRGMGGAVGVDGYVLTTGSATHCGVQGSVRGGSGPAVGVSGSAMGDSSSYGVSGYADGGASNYGVKGMATGGSYNYGVYGSASGGANNFAGYFDGDVQVTGNLSKGGGSFKIDHPLDPENKYLYHSFVESPDMMNVYNGNIVTDDHGCATVVLPEWFGALNRDFRYQLTVVGQFAQAIVAEEIRDNRFSIRTDKPSVKVSWQVTGIRQDPFANAHRIPVEEGKQSDERGLYLHPEAWGQPQGKGIGCSRQQEVSQRREQEPAVPETTVR